MQASPTRAPTAMVVIAQAARDLARLVIPVECPGCGRPDQVCCPHCAPTFCGAVRRVEAQAPRLERYDGHGPLPVWALATYGGAARELILSWKNRGRLDLDPLLAAAARGAARQVAATVAAAVGEPVDPVPGGSLVACPRVPGSLVAAANWALPIGGPRIWVLPAPSSASGRRARGREHVRVIAAGFAAGLRAAGLDARVPRRAALRQRAAPGHGGHQVGQGSRGRGRRLGQVWVTASGRKHLPGTWCVLVDDVLTTGATLAAGETALAGAGALVLAGFVLAATPAPRGTDAAAVPSGASSRPAHTLGIT